MTPPGQDTNPSQVRSQQKLKPMTSPKIICYCSLNIEKLSQFIVLLLQCHSLDNYIKYCFHNKLNSIFLFTEGQFSCLKSLT